MGLKIITRSLLNRNNYQTRFFRILPPYVFKAYIKVMINYISSKFNYTLILTKCVSLEQGVLKVLHGPSFDNIF